MAHNRLVYQAIALFAAALVFSTAAVPATAQPAPGANAQPGPVERALAGRLELFAREQASPLADPTESQLIFAQVLIDRANQLDPTDPERWRAAARIADALDQPERFKDAIKRYIRLAPEDDAAQMRLVQMIVQDKQTVDDRLTFFLRIAEGSMASRFSPALRSRLAHAAATLSREQGFADEHRRLLGVALKLDSTNHAAAADAYSTLVNDPNAAMTSKAAALFTLFHAKPTDPMTHLAVADTLMAFGQYERAVTWYASAGQLLRARGGQADLSIIQAVSMSLWGAGRTDDAVNQLKVFDVGADPAGGDDGEADATEQTPIEMLMLLGAMMVDSADDEALAALHSRIEKRLIKQMRDDDDPGAIASLVWAHLVFNRSSASVPTLLDRLERREGEQPLLRGWHAARTGDRETAKRLLEPLAENDVRAALALAESLATADEPDNVKQRRMLLERVARLSPDDIFGLTAAAKLRKLGLTPPVPAEGKAVDDLFAKVPEKLQRMHTDPLSYVSMRLRAVEPRFEVGQPVWVEIELRNNSPLTLSLGEEGVIPSSLLLTPGVTLGRGPVIPGGNLIDLGRRLRVPAQRSVKVIVRLDTVPGTGRALLRQPFERAQLNVSGVLNPVYTQQQAVLPGLLGARSQVRNIARPTTPIDEAALNQMVDAVGGDDGAATVRALSVMLPLSQREDLLPGQTDAINRLATKLDESFDRLSVAERAFALMCMPSPEVATEPFGRFTERAQRDADPLMQVASLMALAETPDHALINAALRGADEPIKRLAAAYRQLLIEADEKSAENGGDAAENGG